MQKKVLIPKVSITIRGQRLILRGFAGHLITLLIFCSPVQMYRKRYCTIPSIVFALGLKAVLAEIVLAK